MYKDFYHLKSEPFGTHPNTETFFVSNTHKEAWYYLLFGIETEEPFLVLTGEYGMGKTLLCLRLIKALKEKVAKRVEYIPTSNEGYGGILRRIASNLGISPFPEDEEILQEMIYDRFRADTEKSRFYLIIDDAHELDTAILTKLKYLSTFSHNEFFPMIMIFVGHPSFLQDLTSPALSSLNQRIKRRYRLSRFSFEDTKSYIYFRLLKSGAAGIPAFPDETIRKIYEYSKGVPRLINNICDTCLLLGASNHLASITPSVVDDARNLVDGSLSGDEAEVEVETEAEVVKNPDAYEDGGTVITFSEDLPVGDAVKQGAVVSIRADREESRTENTPPQVSTGGLKRRNTVKMAIAAIVLLISGAVLPQLFMNYEKIFAAFTQRILSTAQNNPPVQSEQAAVEIPTLREELHNKPSPETQASLDRTEARTRTPSSSNAPQKQRTNGMDTQSSPTVGSPSSYPFSLRSSSYQQEIQAQQEISEIKQQGLTPYLVRADLGDMGTLWRIYIGFYATEGEAKKVKMDYKLENAVVQKTEYACQVGEFTNETDGLTLFERLKKSGYYPYAIQKGRNSFRLYLGAYEKKAEAEALQQRLEKNGVNSQVVKR